MELCCHIHIYIYIIAFIYFHVVAKSYVARVPVFDVDYFAFDAGAWGLGADKGQF